MSSTRKVSNRDYWTGLALRTYPKCPDPLILGALLEFDIDPEWVPSENAFYQEGYIRFNEAAGHGELVPWPSDEARDTVLELCGYVPEYEPEVHS